jgi:hypothetical protein
MREWEQSNIIILPEMVNAVICPETGKTLKHQELITKLRYKKMDAIHSKLNQQAHFLFPKEVTIPNPPPNEAIE